MSFKGVRRIESVIPRNETLAHIGGDAAYAAMTWTKDGSQLVSLLDGASWPAVPDDDYYSSRLFTVDGGPQNASFRESAGYPRMLIWDYISGRKAPYYGLGMIAIDDHVYQYLSTGPLWGGYDDLGSIEQHFNGVKLIYSPDNGHTWHNQSGSTPVVHESSQDQSRDNMFFLREGQHAFSMLSVLQMGRAYRDNRDGYVYVYGPNGAAEGTMNELVMFRVPKHRMLHRGACEFFAGLTSDGRPRWVPDIDDRAVVHSFQRGWVPPVFPVSWCTSVAYNAALGTYLMVSSAGCSVAGHEDPLSLGQTYFGIWAADQPWGPWVQVHEQRKWAPGGDARAFAALAQLAPKWTSADGKSVWVVWTDWQGKAVEDLAMYEVRTVDDFRTVRKQWRETRPHFGFNTQRFDLVSA